MFDLHITCSRKIKHLNIVFDEDSETESAPEPAKVPERDVQTLPSADDMMMRKLSQRVSKREETKQTEHKTLPTDIINLENRPKCYADELNNLEI